ncbi:hypothetical protein ACWGH2_36210 [Streptomyces sp. NPDC054871]
MPIHWERQQSPGSKLVDGRRLTRRWLLAATLGLLGESTWCST